MLCNGVIYAFRACVESSKGVGTVETAGDRLALASLLSFFKWVCVRRVYWAGMVTKGNRSSPLPSIIVNKNMMVDKARFERQSRSSTQNQ